MNNTRAKKITARMRLVQDRMLDPVRSTYRRAWMTRGIDITDDIATKSCIVVAPHSDDETLGCGVAIMRKREARTRVKVVIATDGRLSKLPPLSTNDVISLRRQETRRACGHLGVDEDDIVFMGFPDGALADHVSAFAECLVAVVSAVRPQQLLIPVSCESHEDHRATNLAVASTAHLLGSVEILEYPVSMWAHWPWTRRPGAARFGPTRVLVDPVDRLRELRPLVVNAAGYRPRHRAAIAEYASQVVGSDPKHPPMRRGLLRAFDGRYEAYFPHGSLRHLDFGG